MRMYFTLVVVAATSLFSTHCAGQSNFPPLLSIQLGNNSTVTLSWTNASPGFVLESTTSMPPSRPWSGILQNPQAVGTKLVVTQAVTASCMFYRLAAKGNTAGYDYLLAGQNGDGSWGSTTTVRDTAGVVETLNLLGKNGTTAYAAGVTALASFSARNNDELSRQIIELVPVGADVSALLTNLSNAQNAELTSTSYTNYPGRGWGLAIGFDDSTIDSALALRALAACGKLGGLSVVNEKLAGSTTSAAHSFILPAGAANLVLKVRALTGSVRFQINYPNGSGSYINLSSNQTPTAIAFPTSSGAFTLTVSNLTSSLASYTAEVGFTGPDGFDVFSVTTPLTYLGLAQNGDGGWGIGPGQDSQFMVTAEVLRSLGTCGATFVGTQVFSSAGTWLLAHQNSDGGFSSVSGVSSAYETSLALLALQAAGLRLSLSNAVSFLKGAQLPDGSWSSDSYQTALALEAMRIVPVVSQIPSQSVISPAAFTNLALDGFVFDADYPPSQISWQVSGNSLIAVTIFNRVAAFTYPPGTNFTEHLTFTATDPNGSSGASTTSFTVTYQLVDYTIARGSSTNDSRVITGAQSVLDKAAYYTLSESNVPPGVTYTTTGFSRTSPTAFTVSYNIAASASAATGIYGFSVQYGLEDSNNNPLGPLTNNVFNFHIQVTP